MAADVPTWRSTIAALTASLQDLLEKYFEFLFEQFGWLYDQMVQHKAPPYAIAARFSGKMISSTTSSLLFVTLKRQFVPRVG